MKPIKLLLALSCLLAFAGGVEAQGAGAPFRLGWDPPIPTDNVTACLIYEHVGTAFNLVKTQALPSVPPNQTPMTGITPGVHLYVAKFQNAGGLSSQYSTPDLSVTVLVVNPGNVQNLIFILGP